MYTNLSETPASFNCVLSQIQLTIGILTPLETYPNSPFPTLVNDQWLAKLAENASIASIWLRDIQFYNPNFCDVLQMLGLFTGDRPVEYPAFGVDLKSHGELY